MKKGILPLTNAQLREASEIVNVMGLDNKAILYVHNKNYRMIKRKFGKEAINKLINHYALKENYEECIKIRDCHKTEKTPI